MNVTQSRKTVTVAIMARNEEPMIEEVVKKCLPHCDEVLVMDGHSSDATREIARAAGARVEVDGGKGKGEAIRRVGQARTNFMQETFHCTG